MKNINQNSPTQKPVYSKNFERNRHLVPKPYQDVAKGMEKQFVQFMIDQMNKSVGESKKGDTANNYYKGLMNNEQAKIMTETGLGAGVQDLILDQIYPQHLRNEANHKAFLESQKNPFEKKDSIEMGPPEPKKNLIKKFEKGVQL